MNPDPKSNPIRLSTRKFKILKNEVFARDRGVCQLCKQTTMAPEPHHAIFRSQGGSDTLDNLLTLCWKCHREIHGGPNAQELREAAVKKMESINEMPKLWG